MAALYKTYRGRGLEILGVNTFNDQEEAARNFVKRYELTFTIGRDVSGAIGRLYSVTGTPTVIFVDKAGLLVERHVGGMSEADFRKRIEDLLKTQVARGHDLYTQNCQECHGDAATGEGAQPGTPLNSAAGHTWHHSDAQLTDILLGRIVTPGRTMPSYAGQLTEQDIQAILSYIKSNWPEDLRRHQAEMK